MEQTISEMKYHLNKMGRECQKFNVGLPIEHFKNCSTHNVSNSGRFQVNLYSASPKSAKLVFDKSLLSKSVIYPDDINNNNKPKNGKDNFEKSQSKNIDHVEKRRLSMDQYLDLKNQRDLECLKLSQISQVLRNLYQNFQFGLWDEKLYAEKILLQTSLAVDLMVNRIRDDHDYLNIKDHAKATISVSNICVENEMCTKARQETEFFLILLLNGTQVQASKVERATNNQLQFNDKFTLSVVSSQPIRLRIYSICMKDQPKIASFTASFRRKQKRSLPTYQIQYKNVNTQDMIEDQILKSSFILQAETIFLPYNYGTKMLPLKRSQPNSTLAHEIRLEVRVMALKIERKQAGFVTLNFGCRSAWNRRWCVLDHQHLNFYDSPNDVDFCTPRISYDLARIANERAEMADRSVCGRSRCLSLDFLGKFHECERIYLRFDSSKELEGWMDGINLVLELLRLWRLNEN